jgi:hypothetical protein
MHAGRRWRSRRHEAASPRTTMLSFVVSAGDGAFALASGRL